MNCQPYSIVIYCHTLSYIVLIMQTVDPISQLAIKLWQLCLIFLAMELDTTLPIHTYRTYFQRYIHIHLHAANHYNLIYTYILFFLLKTRIIYCKHSKLSVALKFSLCGKIFCHTRDIFNANNIDIVDTRLWWTTIYLGGGMINNKNV